MSSNPKDDELREASRTPAYRKVKRVAPEQSPVTPAGKESWFLRDVDGVRTVGHGGSANGQFAELLTVPERDFAVVAVSNSNPDGIPFKQAVVHWALENYIGVLDREPEPLPYDEKRALEIMGRYETNAQTLAIHKNESGLTLEVGIKPEIRAAVDKELPPDYPPEQIGLLPGDKDEYILTSGGLKGQRGYFTRDDSGKIIGVDLAGRLFKRTRTDRKSTRLNSSQPGRASSVQRHAYLAKCDQRRNRR